MYVCLSVYLSIYLYVCMCCDYLVWQHGEDAGEFLQHLLESDVCMSICMSICLSVCLSVCVSVCLYVCVVVSYLGWQHGEDAGEFLQHPHLEGHPLVLLAGQVASQNLVAVRLGGRG